MDLLFLYYLKVNVLISIFTSLFLLVYKRETHFQLNRFFLLAAMVSALLIPAIRISTQALQSIPIQVNEFAIPEFIEEPFAFTEANSTSAQTRSFSWVLALKALYLLGTAILGLRFVLFLVKLISLSKKGALSRLGSTFFVATKQDVQPFSFFNFIFYHADVSTEKDFETIIEHEKVHVNQLHSFDLLITEILVVLFWFNPFVFLLRNLVRANHEFLADAAVLNRGTDKLEYLQTLAIQATSHRFGGFGSHFKSSTLKNRIVMITKKKSSIIKGFKYLLVFPVFALLLYSFSIRVLEVEDSTVYLERGSEYKMPSNGNFSIKTSGSIKKMEGEGILLSNNVELNIGNVRFYGDLFELDITNNKLKILGDSCYMKELPAVITGENEKVKFIQPIKAEQLKRMASGYGMRMHPVYKVRKMHNGVDYAAPTGTPVLAIAPGKIRSVENKPNSYGKYIIVDHPGGFSSLSAQLSNYKVKVGDEVKQGDVVGLVGSSGMSTAPHLHFELKKDGEYVNPVDFIEKD